MATQATESVTLQQVADAAGVSVSTASRALRGNPAISDVATAKICRVAKSMNYQPLRKRKQRSSDPQPSGELGLKLNRLAVVTLGMAPSLVSLPAVADSIGGTEEAVSATGAKLHLLNLPYLKQTPPMSLQLDGVFLLGAMQGRHVADSSDPFVQQLLRIPHVWLLGRPEGCSGDAVGAGDVQLGSMAADYLADRGHRDVAFVGPKPDHLLMMRREGGFLSQAIRRGLNVERFVESPTQGWTVPVKPPLTTDSVQALIDQMLESEKPITAIFAASDSVAAMCYRALAVRGLQVGKDMSVISGNNDTAIIQSLYPSLTTFDIHARDLGLLAVSQLAARLSTGNKLPDVEISLEPTLVEGESVRSLL
ncbi:putative HTH-type transcriptional repressor ExuR [Thalassoglobus neptunius]|uniref:Putative HTH-type transcriptional repressor ExuR n=1 Tax=Thalassoglobus neptunius TaxID=1938619 RepID=A0A5C5VPT5_9PLAN|nr:LacI family DNA-binding transcriptional regulator [Thalassoglobus neptunius]TWT40616.1 putative HTH-type transcriptional repressor ExuR [Thalassoglobus neptunius]